MRSSIALLWLLIAAVPVPAVGQHDMHDMHEAPAHDESLQQAHQMTPTPAAQMMMANPIGLPASRFGSGTAWLPDSTPMYGLTSMSGAWHMMYHGRATVAYDDQNGPRGDQKMVGLNWAMAMAQRNLGQRNQLRLSAMLSLEPETVGGEGYPLLFQTGETWNGQPLVNRQHPHNFVSELSAKYTRAVTAKSAYFVYAAPVGEPALGPVSYMHRAFGLDDPVAPLGHHWQDATHIAYGVVTVGYQRRSWQLEGSTFNGREPGENRYEIVGPEFDSFSTRLSYNPSANWALQGSYAFLKSPEAIHPDEDTHRASASATYNRSLGPSRNLESTFVWGRNVINGNTLDSFLIEAQLKKDGGWTPYARYEWVQKNAEELVLADTFAPDKAFDLQQITLGVVRDLPLKGSFQWGIGIQANLNIVPNELVSVYGDNPTGWFVYLRVHPKRMSH